MMKTTLAKADTEKSWYVIDAKGQVLGRLAVKIANLLRGRNKAIYTPHIDTGDYVVVINAKDVDLTGKKWDQKEYMFYSGWRGNEKYVNVSDMNARRPDFLIFHSVKGMLPNNKLADKMLTKLKVFSGAEHTHSAQNPVPYKG